VQLPDRACSCHVTDVTSGKKNTRADIAQLPVAHAQNILPVQVTDVTSVTLLPLGRGRRREHPNDTFKGKTIFAVDRTVAHDRKSRDRK
jgi:hypothetical protein